MDLNADEDIVIAFLSFMRIAYESVFSGKKLADKSKLWHVKFLLQLLYGGWMLVRTVFKSCFSLVKNIQYSIVLNILDNYIPLALNSYSILFKTNLVINYFFHFQALDYVFCSHRRNYKKAPLFWLIKHLILEVKKLQRCF